MQLVLTLEAAEAEPWVELIKAALPEAHIVQREPDAPRSADATAADFLIVGQPCGTLFDEQPTPRAIFTLSAGIAFMLALPNLPRGVPLIRVEDAGMAGQMQRYALAAALRFSQRLDQYARQQRAADWTQHPPRDPASLTVGVLGLGVIGGGIARVLAAQGFAVRGCSRRDHAIAGVTCFAADHFHEFLDGLDLLISVLPSTLATKGLLDRVALSRLADGAHLVNMGRGAVLVEADLLALLDAGKLSGATLDVFAQEPLPAGHPLWSRPDVAVTPHVSGLTDPAATVAQIAAKIRRIERGEPVTGVVDRARGY